MIILRVFLPFALGYFLSYLYRTVNAVIAPDLIRDVQLDASDLGLLTSMYFVTFAIFQLPLGLLLDRYGPRKTEAVLLIFAAIGAYVFAISDSLSGLIIGRGLIGLGVSACLMAAFKAYVTWLPKDKLPLINGWQMAAGGLGAITATYPVETALQFTDWRGVFMVLSVFSLVVAVAILIVVPKHQEPQTGSTFRQQARGFITVFKSPVFIRLVPFTVTSQATFLSIQGLWIGPWLGDVAGLEREVVAHYLLLMAISLVAGFIVVGTLAERLSRVGIKPATVTVTCLSIFVILTLLLCLNWTGAVLPMVMAFSFFGTTGIISYAALSQHFPSELAGRVNTSLNMLVFAATFLAQWGIGVVIGLWPSTGSGGFTPEGYQAAFLIMLSLQVLTLIWYGVYRKDTN